MDAFISDYITENTNDNENYNSIIDKQYTFNEIMDNVKVDYKYLTLTGYINNVIDLSKYNKPGYAKIVFTVSDVVMLAKDGKRKRFNYLGYIQSIDDYKNSSKALTTSINVKINKQIEDIRNKIISSEVFYKIVGSFTYKHFMDSVYLTVYRNSLKVMDVSIEQYNEDIEALPLTDALVNAFKVWRPNTVKFEYTDLSEEYAEWFARCD